MAVIGDVNESYNLEFRSTKDDAWYTAGVVIEDGKHLRVKFQDFPETFYDEVFSVADFSTHGEIEDFLRRFRPLSLPMEDNECSRVVEGMLVCATYTRDGSIRFFDAIIDDVHYKEHTPEKCLCTYFLSWQYGPDEGNVTSANIDEICLPTPGTLDAKVTDFAKLLKEKLNRPTRDTEAPFLSRKTGSNQILDKLQGSGSVGRSSYDGFSGGRGGLYPQPSDQDTDLGGVKKSGFQHYIILENLEKGLSPSLMKKFIHEQTYITAQAYVFPSLSVETYARGVILTDSRLNLKRIYDFISNPNHFVVSLTGRPWVIAEGTQTGTFESNSQNLQPKFVDNDIKSKLMVVRLGTEEYVRAKQLKDLFMEFRNHLNGLLIRLDAEEKKNSHIFDEN